MIPAGASYLRILGVCEMFMCIELMTVGAMSGLGRTMEASVITIILTALRIPMAIVLGTTALGLDGVWWALTISSIIKGIVFLFIISGLCAGGMFVRNDGAGRISCSVFSGELRKNCL